MAAIAAVALAGCATSTESGAQGTSPECARVIEKLPDQLMQRKARATTAQGTAAWGKPPVVLRCGVPVPTPTTVPCLGIGEGANQVDWVMYTDPDRTRFVSYGRSPAVEVTVPAAVSADQPAAFLVDLGPAVASIPATAHCS